MLRVLHLLDTTQFAGTEKHVLLLMQELKESGVGAVLACRFDSPLRQAAVQQGLNVVPIFGRYPPLRTLRVLAEAARGKNVDLIHAHNGRTMLMAALLHRKIGTPVVATQHFLAPQFTTYRGVKKLVAQQGHHWVNGQTSQFIAISESVRRAMLSRERLPPHKIVTVPNGIAPLAAPSTERLEALRHELGIKAARPVVVCVARLGEEKGLSYLLKAVPDVLKQHSETHFIVVGEGPLRHQLEQAARTLEIEHALTLTGFRQDAVDVIALGDIFVLPSLAEPFGLVLLEAMALNKPVVTTRAGGPLEIVVDEETGLLVPPGDSAALAKAIIGLLHDVPKARLMGQKGQERFQQNYTAQQMTKATLDVYQAALGS